jgi:hypothetical protein
MHDRQFQHPRARIALSEGTFMDHPILVAALAEDRRRQYSCGAVTQKPNGMCRQCHAATVSRHEIARSSCRTTSRWPTAGIAKARIFAWVASLLQIIGKGAES